MAEHGTPDLISSRAPFIQALVQKSVTAITNPAGQLSFRMLWEAAITLQGAKVKTLHQRARKELHQDFHTAKPFLRVDEEKGGPVGPPFDCFTYAVIFPAVGGWLAEQCRLRGDIRPSVRNGQKDAR